MHRDQLDMRGKTMTELMEMDAEIGTRLDLFMNPDSIYADGFLADRRQIREEMERRRDIDNADARYHLRHRHRYNAR